MSISIGIESLGIAELAADIRDAKASTPRKTVQAVEVSARTIKDDARARAGGLGHAPHYPRSIGYDVTTQGLFGVRAEIGPDKNGPQGALGNILEYGTSNNAPIPHLGPAFAAETPKFVGALERILDGSL